MFQPADRDGFQKTPVNTHSHTQTNAVIITSHLKTHFSYGTGIIVMFNQKIKINKAKSWSKEREKKSFLSFIFNIVDSFLNRH